jgi:hypothetical protein
MFFRGTCNQVGITPRELLLWICMHWGSLYKFLEHFLYLKAVSTMPPPYLSPH